VKIDSMDQTDHDLRARVVDAAIAAYRSGNFHAVGPVEVAAQAGLCPDDVRRLYPVWEILVVAVVDRWSGGLRRSHWHLAEEVGTISYMRAVLEAINEERGLIRLRLAMISAASNPGHPAAGWFRTEYGRIYQDLALALVRDVVAGREPRTMAPRHAAEQLLALYEGLQLQTLLRDDADLLSAFDRAVARMRAGWAAAYSAPSSSRIT
jgi:hypothetical protein